MPGENALRPRSCAVIGAGVLGAGVAARLAEAGIGVTLLEQAEPGRAATRSSFAWLNANHKAPSGQALSAEKRPLAPSAPFHSTSGGQWMDRAYGPDPGALVLPPPSSNAPQSAATAPDNEPANCSACRGEKTVAER